MRRLQLPNNRILRDDKVHSLFSVSNSIECSNEVTHLV